MLPASGKNNYRIKVTGTDGKSIYSRTIEARLEKGLELVLFPNPVSETFRLEALGDYPLTQVTILDSKGRPVFYSEGITGRSAGEVNVKSLAPGVYVVCAKGVDGRVSTVKMIKR